MTMTLNEVMTKQTIISPILLQDGDKELNKALKVKIMRIRMTYNKIKKNFDAEVQEFVDALLTDEFKELNDKERTPEEETRLQELNASFNSEYKEFLIQKGNEEVSCTDEYFTVDEYYDIVDINSGNNVEINGSKVSAPNFLEVVYELFVRED